MPISIKRFSKKRVKKSVRKNTRKYKKRTLGRKHRKSGKRPRFFGGNPTRYIILLQGNNPDNGNYFLKNIDIIREMNVMDIEIDNNNIPIVIKQIILDNVNERFGLQLQQNDIDVLVDGNHLIMQIPSNLEQYIDDTFRIVDGLPNFINEISFSRMTNLANDMDEQYFEDNVRVPMENMNITGSDDDI